VGKKIEVLKHHAQLLSYLVQLLLALFGVLAVDVNLSFLSLSRKLTHLSVLFPQPELRYDHHLAALIWIESLITSNSPNFHQVHDSQNGSSVFFLLRHGHSP
jgi:hypothetical protein